MICRRCYSGRSSPRFSLDSRWRRARRNPSFPHETTLDQLFSEEQFEAYRNLGFHAVNAVFKHDDKVSMNPAPVFWQGATSPIPLERQLRTILGWHGDQGLNRNT